MLENKEPNREMLNAKIKQEMEAKDKKTRDIVMDILGDRLYTEIYSLVASKRYFSIISLSLSDAPRRNSFVEFRDYLQSICTSYDVSILCCKLFGIPFMYLLCRESNFSYSKIKFSLIRSLGIRFLLSNVASLILYWLGDNSAVISVDEVGSYGLVYMLNGVSLFCTVLGVTVSLIALFYAMAMFVALFSKRFTKNAIKG